MPWGASRNQRTWPAAAGSVWQIDHDESWGWNPGSVTAGARLRMTQGPAKQRALWTALAQTLGPLAPPVPRSASCLCHSTSKSNPWSKAKEKKGDEKREETEKWKGRWRLTCMLGGRAGREQQTSLYLTGEAAARAGAPVCLLPPKLTPSSALVPASARPMKSCHGNTPKPWAEINNLSTSSEEGNL